MKKARGSRAKILGLLREQDGTVRDLATRLGLTNNAVRAHLVALQKEGLARRGGLQTGRRKPHVVYTLTENAIHGFPNAYGRLLRAFVAVLAKQLSRQALMGYLRQLGRELAREPAQEAHGKSPTERRRIALKLLVALGGEPSLKTIDEAEFIEGRFCPLATLTGPLPETCVIAQTIISEIIGRPVQQSCVHGRQPRCRFQISA
jgi:predicted ArsR family transcriptional regulator